MKILTRNVIIQGSCDDAAKVLKSSAYYFPKAIFDQGQFSMRCAKRYMGKDLLLIPVKGTITEAENKTIVVLEIHASWIFYVDTLLTLLGLLVLVRNLIYYSQLLVPGVGMTLLGMAMMGRSFGIGAEILDRLEHKLRRDAGSSCIKTSEKQ